MKEKLAIGAALAVAGLSVLALRHHLAQERLRLEGGTERIAYIVAGANLAKGTVLSAQDLSSVRYPRATPVSSAVEVSHRSYVIGRPLLRDRKAGEPILWLDIPETGQELADAVPLSQRAVTLPLDEAGALSGLLKPRDHVDVFCLLPMPGGPDQPPQRVARLLIPNVTILAVGRITPFSEGDEGGPSTVTVAVKPSEAQLLALAQQEGDLFLALRHPQDLGGLDPSGAPDVRTEHLYQPERLEELSRQQRERVEIYKEGIPQPR